MSKSNKNNYTLYTLQIPILILAGLFIFGATYYVETQKPDQEVAGAVLGKGNEKSNNGNQNQEKVRNNFTGDTKVNSGNSNAALHRQNVTKVVGSLKKIAQDEEIAGNDEVSQEVEEVAQDEENQVDDVAEAINQVENRPKWKTLLLGSDYKNLGQLRSHLAHNTNSIRKLVGVQSQVSNQTSEDNISEQLSTLLDERDRIINVISDHEDDFGILGWASRLISGYLGGGIDQGDLDPYVDVSQTTESTQSLPGTTEPSPAVTQ